MTETENEILDCLFELERAAQSQQGDTHKLNLLALFERIDELTAQLPRGGNPDLLHFLHKKSYEKARLHLLASRGES